MAPIGNNPGSTGNIISSALSWNPTQAFKVNGIFNNPSNGSGNPLAMSEAYDDQFHLNAFLGNISAAYKILPSLEYKFLYGINHQAGHRELNIAGWLQGFPGVSGQGNAAILDSRLTSQIFTHTLNYRTDLTKNLSLDAIAGYEYYKVETSGGGVSASGYNTNLDYPTPVSYTHLTLPTNREV